MLHPPDPRTLAQRIEQTPSLPPGPEERFRGYAVLGIGYASGHVLALRRFPHTSLGPAYTSVWHHSPDRHWTIYTDIDASLSCPRYFGRAITATRTTPIAVTWTGPHTLMVSMEQPSLEWMLQLSSTPATRAFNVANRLCPERARRTTGVLSIMARASGAMLDAGTIRLHGRVPNGQSFAAVPRSIWTVDRGAAILGGRDLGRVRFLLRQIRLADLLIPRRGIFAAADAYFERFDRARHAVALMSPGTPHTNPSHSSGPHR